MEVRTIEFFQFGQDEKCYILTRVAAKYLHISHDRLQGFILLGKLKSVYFGSREFIELETLKAFAEKQHIETSGWGRVDAFIGREHKR